MAESVDARRALAHTSATTLAGLAALLRFANYQSSMLETSFFDEKMGELLPFFAAIDKSLTAICARRGR